MSEKGYVVYCIMLITRKIVPITIFYFSYLFVQRYINMQTSTQHTNFVSHNLSVLLGDSFKFWSSITLYYANVDQLVLGRWARILVAERMFPIRESLELTQYLNRRICKKVIILKIYFIQNIYIIQTYYR